MLVRKVLIWSLLNKGRARRWHPAVTDEEMRWQNLKPLFSALFPGIACSSISACSLVRHNYAVPVLRKLYPKLVGTNPETVLPEEQVEVEAFFPSDGNEWGSDQWQSQLNVLLAA